MYLYTYIITYTEVEVEASVSIIIYIHLLNIYPKKLVIELQEIKFLNQSIQKESCLFYYRLKSNR